MPIYKPTTAKIQVVANYAALIALTPYEGMQVLTQDKDIIWTYTIFPQGAVWVPPPGTHIQALLRGATQSIPNITATPIIWEGYNYQFNPSMPNQFWHPSLPSRVLIGWPGKYRFDTYVTFGTNATGIRKHQWGVNGAAFDTCMTIVPGTTLAPGPAWAAASLTLKLTASDYIESMVSQTSGVALNACVSALIIDVTYLGP